MFDEYCFVMWRNTKAFWTSKFQIFDKHKQCLIVWLGPYVEET